MSILDRLTGQDRPSPANAEFIAVLADEASAALLRQFVLEGMVSHAHVLVGGVRDLIALLGQVERPPRQLVVDVSGSTMSNTELAELAAVCPPGVSVVVVGERNDVGTYRELLRMGVDDYLVKPLTMDLLRRVLNRRTGRSIPAQQIRTGKVVACVGSRGGIGTSTLVANLGWHLAGALERRVAAIDLDPFGGALDLMLSAQNNHGLTDLLANVNQLDPNFVERSFAQAAPRLFLLSARADLDQSGLLPPRAVLTLLGELRKLFHYVFLDLPARGGELTAALLADADTVVVVSEPSVVATRETLRLIQLAETRDDRVPLMLLVNHPRQPGHAELKQADFEEAVGRRASHVLPFDRDAAGLGENLGPPLISRRGPLALALRRVADDLAGRRSAESGRRLLPDWLPLPGLAPARGG